MNYYLYILKSHTGTYYVGITSNLENRVNYHNKGKVKSTKFSKPWVLIYKESYSTLSEANKREREIKNWKSRKAIERLI